MLSRSRRLMVVPLVGGVSAGRMVQGKEGREGGVGDVLIFLSILGRWGREDGANDYEHDATRRKRGV